MTTPSISKSSEELAKHIDECSSWIAKYPEKLKDSDEHFKTTMRLLDEWVSEYVNNNIKHEALSISELRWLAYALSLACKVAIPNKGTPLSEEECLKTHGFVRMVLAEWNFRAHEWLPTIEKLELQCITVVSRTPQIEEDANFAEDYVYDSHFDADSKPNVYDYDEDSSWDDVGLRLTEPKDPKEENEDEEEEEGKEEKKEEEKKIVDWTDPANYGKVELFKVKRFSAAAFVMDCSRLFYWAFQYEQFLDEHKICDSSSDHVVSVYESNLVGVLNKQSKIENTQTEEMFDLLFLAHMPIGCHLSYRRHHLLSLETILENKEVLEYDIGEPLVQTISAKMIPRPDKALLIKDKNNLVYESWVLLLFHQRMYLCKCDFLREFVFRSESIVHQHEFLYSETQWVIRKRRPVLIKLCGVWYVQLKGELWKCKNVVQALAVWCHLMKEKFECSTSSRIKLDLVINEICVYK